MKQPKMLLKNDLRWIRIERDLMHNIEEAADFVKPNTEMAKLCLVNNEKHIVFLLAEKRVLPIMMKHFSGTSRDYYSDEQYSYSYDDYATMQYFSNFDATPEIAKLTSSVHNPTISYEDALKLEKLQNKFILGKQKQAIANSKKYAVQSKNYARMQEKKNQEAKKIKDSYPEVIKE